VVGVGEIVEDCEVDAEDSHRRTADSQGRQDPVVARERRPAEPEASNREERTLYAGKVEAAFRAVEDGEMFAGEVFAGDTLLAHADERADYCCNGDGGEDGAVLLTVETVAGGKDDWDRGEGEVEYSPGERNPQTEEKDDTFSEEKMEGSV